MPERKPRATATKSREAMDPIKMLKDDHKKVKELFEQFEATDNKRSKGRIAREAILELDVHAGIEEEIFYPAFLAEASDEEKEFIHHEAEEEHHLVHVLIDELRSMDESDEYFEAKFTVLAENVKHHIKEEEKEMLPKTRALGKERLQELGEEMSVRKAELMKQFKAQAAERQPARNGASNGR